MKTGTGKRASAPPDPVSAAPPGSAAAAAPDPASATDRTAVAVMAVVMLLSFLLMAAGLLAAAVGVGGGEFDGRHPAGLLPGLSRAEPEALATAGILALLVSPIIRLVVLTVGFGRRREWLFLGLAALVLVELAVSAVLVSGR